jgi:hypothetical protein
MRTQAFVDENFRALKRARKSLYSFPIADRSPASMFLFAGWLRLEEKSRRAIGQLPFGYSVLEPSPVSASRPTG